MCKIQLLSEFIFFPERKEITKVSLVESFSGTTRKKGQQAQQIEISVMWWWCHCGAIVVPLQQWGVKNNQTDSSKVWQSHHKSERVVGTMCWLNESSIKVSSWSERTLNDIMHLSNWQNKRGGFHLWEQTNRAAEDYLSTSSGFPVLPGSTQQSLLVVVIISLKSLLI